nr:uncharacterized protein LOC131769580 [Pocillopora verrucosa]
MYAVTKLNKQHEQTWINLQKRLNTVQFQYQKLFHDSDVYDFVKNKAISVGSCEGYFVPSLLTTTSFILACNNAKVNVTTHKQPLNIYTIFVGYPGTGKSSAIQYAAQDPLEQLDLTNAIISKTTSSGLVKLLANKKKAMILSLEVFDILHKLLKSDEETASGDVQLLCKLFSGEHCSYHYSTEESRVIPSNTPFCLLGSTQLVNAAKLIARMDQGHGLVDRILLATPLALRPTLTQMENATDQLSTEVVSDYTELFKNINGVDENVEFVFDDEGKELLREKMDQFVAEVNEAIREGKVPPKSKTPELIPRFLKEVTNSACDKTIKQPTTQMVRDNVLISQGPVVSYRSFKHGKRSAREIAEDEFNAATESLMQDGFGRIVEFCVPRARSTCKAGICSEAQTIAINDLDNPFAVLSEEIQSLREAYPEAVPANVNADDVIGIDDAVSTSESGSLTDEEILAEFSSDQEAMEEEEETDEVEVLEECPKKPTASEVRSAIDVLTSYSLFVNEGVEEIRSHVQKIEALAERNFRSSQRQQTLLSFFGSKMQSPLNNKDQ